MTPAPMTGLPVDPQYEAALASFASRLLSDPDVYLMWTDAAKTSLLVDGSLSLTEDEWAAVVLVAAAADKGIA